MRHLAFALAISSALAMGACSTVESIESNLASPTTTQAAINAGKIVDAVACGISSLASAASGVASSKNSNGQTIGGNSANNIISTIYVSSQAACVAIGGIVQGIASVPTTSITPVVANGVAQ